MDVSKFWDQLFREIDLMWGKEPAASAQYALRLFKTHGIKKILIPGMGYGRNAQLFYNNDFDITGIEISPHAIELARNTMQLTFPVYCGSVNDMPFDNEQYEGIYCHALVHLLHPKERKKFINNCLHQLQPGGYLVFSIISKASSLYGQGKFLSTDRYLLPNGVSVKFYDVDSAKKEFGAHGATEVFTMDEPITFKENELPLKMIMVKIKKPGVPGQNNV